MDFSIVRTTWERVFSSKRLKCQAATWEQIHHELKARGMGRRESGGFLLGSITGNSRLIEKFLPYDDIDPACLRGHIVFDGSKMDMVWRECRRLGLKVVADVHTHPGGYRQSLLDQDHPMIPERGHLALIIPNFAKELYLPGEIGIYEFASQGLWLDHSRRGSTFFSIGRS